MTAGLTAELVREAAAYLSGRIRRTPVEFSPDLSKILGAPVWMKLESLQLTGSFKIRGALFRIKPAGKAPDSGVVGLYEVVKIINSTLNLEEVLNRVLDLAIRRLRAERGMILLLDPITNALRTRVSTSCRSRLELMILTTS